MTVKMTVYFWPRQVHVGKRMLTLFDILIRNQLFCLNNQRDLWKQLIGFALSSFISQKIKQGISSQSNCWKGWVRCYLCSWRHSRNHTNTTRKPWATAAVEHLSGTLSDRKLFCIWDKDDNQGVRCSWVTSGAPRKIDQHQPFYLLNLFFNKVS